jgi:hypothetical protein
VYFSIKHAGRIVRSNPRDAYEQGLRDGRAELPPYAHHIEPTRPWPRT